jgi:hypothetical protein
MPPPTGCKIAIPCNLAIVIKKEKRQDVDFSYCKLQKPGIPLGTHHFELSNIAPEVLPNPSPKIPRDSLAPISFWRHPAGVGKMVRTNHPHGSILGMSNISNGQFQFRLVPNARQIQCEICLRNFDLFFQGVGQGLSMWISPIQNTQVHDVPVLIAAMVFFFLLGSYAKPGEGIFV